MRSRLNMARHALSRRPTLRIRSGKRDRLALKPAVHPVRCARVMIRNRLAMSSWRGAIMGTSYHLSVVVDDADQGITDVMRGEDLFGATAIHVVLQRLLGLPTPVYHHHRLIRDEHGKRLAKRDDARALSATIATRAPHRPRSAAWSGFSAGRGRTISRRRALRCKNRTGGPCDRPDRSDRPSAADASRSQSEPHLDSRCTWPEVSPLTQNAARERDQ